MNKTLRCTDSCGLFTARHNLTEREEYGRLYYECRWCKRAATVEESIRLRREEKENK